MKVDRGGVLSWVVYRTCERVPRLTEPHRIPGGCSPPTTKESPIVSFVMVNRGDASEDERCSERKFRDILTCSHVPPPSYSFLSSLDPCKSTRWRLEKEGLCLRPQPFLAPAGLYPVGGSIRRGCEEEQPSGTLGAQGKHPRSSQNPPQYRSKGNLVVITMMVMMITPFGVKWISCGGVSLIFGCSVPLLVLFPSFAFLQARSGTHTSATTQSSSSPPIGRAPSTASWPGCPSRGRSSIRWGHVRVSVTMSLCFSFLASTLRSPAGL